MIVEESILVDEKFIRHRWTQMDTDKHQDLSLICVHPCSSVANLFHLFVVPAVVGVVFGSYRP